MSIPLMLPVRLETRFYPVGGSPTELRVRVVPDDAWFDDHQPVPTEAERLRLEAWRAALAEDDAAASASDEVRRRAAARLAGAWRRLVDVAGVGRARWLAELEDDGSASGSPADRVRRAIGFPERLEVWLFADLAAPDLAAGPRLVLEPDADALRLDLPDATPDSGAGARWWNSYDAALDRGLAGAIALTDRDRAALPFDCLMVVGLGDTPADALFRGHRDTGRFAVLTPGLATNTVAGGSTPSRGEDPTSQPGSDEGADGLDQLARLLVGADALAPARALPGAEIHDTLQAAVVTGLWPTLWGHSLNNLWLTGEGAHEVGGWAATALRPEGPLPPVRVGDQPYGILPVTALQRFAGHDGAGDPETIHRRLIPRLLRARETWLAAAEADGTVVGADIDRLLDLAGRAPVSRDLVWRKLVPHDLALLLEAAEDRGRSASEHADWWSSFTEELETFALLPQRRLSAVYGAREVELPLVVPDGSDPAGAAAALRALLSGVDPAGAWRPADFASAAAVAERMGTDGSVLLRLARAAVQLALADAGRAAAGDPAPTLDNPLQSTPSRLAGWIGLATPDTGTPQGRTLQRVLAALRQLSDLVERDAPAVERVLRGALDCAAYRLDAWLSGPATFRLRQALDEDGAANAAGRLGAYGWVDDLAPGGGGPTAGGAILAPAHSSAAAAAVLRDRHLRATEDGDVSWSFDVTSTRARDAKRLADAVGAGLHPAVALGLEVERLVDDPIRVAELRLRFPARRTDDGRRVSDGMKALAAAARGENLWDDLDGHALTFRIRDRMQHLMDTYADLVTAEAVHRTVDGRGAIAGQVLDGAAGLGPPPTLDILHAPPVARHIETVVVTSLPVAALSAEPRPVDMADPSVAAFLDDRFGGGSWHWTVRITGPGLTEVREVTLGMLGLRPADTACHAPESLEALAIAEAVDRTAEGRGISRAGLAGVVEDAAGTETRRRMGRSLRAIGARPFTLSDLSPGATSAARSPEAIADAERVARDLLGRLVALAGAAGNLAGELRTATGEPLERALEQLRHWGIALSTGAAADPERAATNLERRVQNADRLLRDAAPAADADLIGTIDLLDLDALPARARGALLRVPPGELGPMIAGLAGPEGDVAVLSIPETGSAAAAPLRALADAPMSGPVTDWLATVAAVRPRLAELEADLLERETTDDAGSTLSCTHPDDPWQLAAATATGATGERTAAPGPMIVELGQAGSRLAGAEPVALALVDRFAEQVPEPRRPPSMAFGFNAPGARAPQAFLALVPPEPVTSWAPTGADLAEIVLEARMLARVRMALPSSPDIEALAAFLPTAMLPLNGPVGFDPGGEV